MRPKTNHPLSPASAANPDQAAAGWLARRDAGLSQKEQAEFISWLAADSLHTAAWEKVESAWMAFDRARNSAHADDMIRELAARRHRRAWKLRAGIASGLAAAAAVFFVFLARPADTGAILSKPDQRVLADGSVIELNRGAVITVNYSPARREILLLRGEALFSVAKNAARPFLVTTGRVQVHAVGTTFSVRLGARAVDVLVTEGKVAVNLPADRPDSVGSTEPRSKPVLVGAGDQLVVPATTTPGMVLQVQALPPAEIEHRLAWRGPRLELSGTRLKDAVAVFNRENRVQIAIADPALAELRLSGIFRADNAEGFVRLLEANYDVQAERRDLLEIVLRTK